MSNQRNPLQALRDLTQKRTPHQKAGSTESFQEKPPSLRPNLSLDTQNINDDNSANEAPGQNDPRANNKTATRIAKSVIKPQSFQYFRAEDILNRISPSTRLPSRDSPKVGNNNLFVSKNKERAEADPTFLIKTRIDKGFQQFTEESYHDAHSSFSQAEALIERYCSAEKKLPFEVVFLTFYNMIAVNYRLKKLDDSLGFVNNCMLNFELSKEQRNIIKKPFYNFSIISDQMDYLRHCIKKTPFRKLKCKIHLQACIINSETEKHKEALCHAREAGKAACSLIINSLIVCYRIYLKHRETEQANKLDSIKRDHKPPRVNVSGKLEEFIYGFPSSKEENPKLDFNDSKSSLTSDTSLIAERNNENTINYNDPLLTSSPSKIEYIEKLIPILEEIVNKIKDKKSLPGSSNQSKLLHHLRKQMQNYYLGPANMGHLYDDLPESHFLYNSNIMAIIQLKAVKSSMIMESADLYEELLPDKIIEQILLVVTSLYAISTELRFWDDSANKGTQKSSTMTTLMNEYFPRSSLRKASEMWIGRSLEFAFVYLPHDCPLADQIFNIYTRLYSPTKFMIPEEDEVEHGLKYLTPAKGIIKSSQFFIPIIKIGRIEEDIESLLTFDREITGPFAAKLKQTSLIDRTAKYYPILQKNYTRDLNTSLEGSFANGFGKPKSSNTRLNRIYNNHQMVRGMSKRPARSPANHENSQQRIRFPEVKSDINVPIQSREEPKSSLSKLKENNFFRPQSQERSSLEKENFQKPPVVINKPNIRNRLTISTPNDPATAFQKGTPDKREGPRLTPKGNERIKIGRPPSPKNFTTGEINVGGIPRKVDININNNISVIINNNQISPHHFDPANIINLNPEVEFDGDQRPLFIPKPPSKNDPAFRRNVKPNRPPDNGRNSSFTRKTYLQKDDSRESQEVKRDSSAISQSAISQGSQGSDILIPANILDGLIEEKRADRSVSNEKKAFRQALPEKGPIRVMRPESQTDMKGNKDLSFKFEDSDLIDVNDLVTNQTMILNTSNDLNKTTNIRNLSFESAPSKPRERKILIRRAKKVDQRIQT